MGSFSYQGVFLSADVGDIHVVGGWGQIFKLLASEDVDGDDVDLGVAVFSSFGSGHFNDLAGSLVDDDEAVLSKGRTLHGKGGRGASIGRLEGVVLLSHILLVNGFCEPSA